MKVFLSSVVRGLQDERTNVAALLEALGEPPVRFEDFGAVDASSRVACVDGVAAADVYVLLLGQYYGARQPDSGLSATEEEFNVARTRGKPVLVFKKTGINMEPDQEAFANRVGSYANGRFWGEFTDATDLGPKVIAALRALPIQPVEPAWRPVQASKVRPIHNSQGRRTGAQPAYTNVLEVHVLPLGPVNLRPASGQRAVIDQAIHVMRTTGLISSADAVQDMSGTGVVHVRGPSQPSRSGLSGVGSVTSDPYCGVLLRENGTSVAYQALPSDVIGSLTSESDLTTRILMLLDQVVPFLPADAVEVVVSAVLCDEGRTQLGDPGQLGRTSGVLGFGGGDLVLPADRAIRREALTTSRQAVAREIATRLVEGLRER